MQRTEPCGPHAAPALRVGLLGAERFLAARFFAGAF